MEFLDVVDESGNPTGETVSRSDAHRKGIAHRTSHVWIIRRINDRVQILLQKRSMQKESFPGKYDTSSAGHIPAGFEPVGSALRELEEELGIRAEREQLESIGTIRVNYQRQFHGSLYIDNEYVNVFVYHGNVDPEGLSLQASEVDDVQWFDLDETIREIQFSRERFCVPYDSLVLLKRYLPER